MYVITLQGYWFDMVQNEICLCYVHVHTHTHAHTHTHIYTYTYTHTHVYTYGVDWCMMVYDGIWTYVLRVLTKRMT